MRTGEGKTFIPTLAAVLNGLTGRGAHVVTVNDYLARRDAQWMGPAYHFLGLSVGVITHDTSYLFEPGFPDDRRAADQPAAGHPPRGLRRGHHLRHQQRVRVRLPARQHGRPARGPGAARALVRDRRRGRQHPHRRGADAAHHLGPGRGVGGPVLHLRPPRARASSPGPSARRRAATTSSTSRTRPSVPTEEGIDKIEQLLGIENLYDADPRLARHFDSALKAHALYKRDRDYIVEDGEIVIVDEFTGRKMPGRRWSEGLHQAIEAKEGLRVQRESRTLATITFQNYFRLYDKLAGMTGTAMTEAEEFHKIYNLEVVAIPTHRPMIRDDYPDLVFKNEASKFNALIDEIEEMTTAGRPGPRRHRVGREVRGPLDAAQAARHQARDAQRQVPRARGGRRRAGGPQRRRHDRHQHGRPRHGHQARRQPGGPRVRDPPQARPQPGRGGRGDLRRGARRGEGGHRRRPREGRGGGRPAHHRHRAPREPAHRQPAARPRRAPGRPGLVALLPLARRRPDEAVRVGPGRRPHGAPGPRGRHGDRVAARVARRSRAPRPASRASTSTSASASSSSTTSSTSSARRSTPSATRSCATRT